MKLNHLTKKKKKLTFPLPALFRSAHLPWKSRLTIYFYHFFLEPILREIKKEIAKAVKSQRPEKVLDVCCGTGAQVRLIASPGIKVLGIDLDEPMIQFASRKNSPASFLVADALHLPFKESSFSLALISFALHDKPEETRVQIIEEMKRILPPKGRLLLLDFENSWDRRSQIGAVLRTTIERLAGRAHFRNGQEFLQRGGLTAFIQRSGLREESRHHFPLAATALVVARIKVEDEQEPEVNPAPQA